MIIARFAAQPGQAETAGASFGPRGHIYQVPELPDVEGLRRLLAATAAGQRVRGVEAPAPQILRNTTPQRLGRALAGRRLGEPWRHGKWLFLPVLDTSSLLLMHFGMDGALRWTQHPAQPADRYDRLVVRCDGGDLRYRSVRKLGGVWLAAGRAQADAVTGPLGPDALGLPCDRLAARLARRRGAVKPALLDQACVAGLGNLTADEALWRAGLHPLARAGSLDRGDMRALHRAVRQVLAGSVPAGRVPDTPGWLTAVRSQPAAACPRCGTPLARGRVGGRGTVWCPRCQPGPADGIRRRS